MQTWRRILMNKWILLGFLMMSKSADLTEVECMAAEQLQTIISCFSKAMLRSMYRWATSGLSTLGKAKPTESQLIIQVAQSIMVLTDRPCCVSILWWTFLLCDVWWVSMFDEIAEVSSFVDWHSFVSNYRWIPMLSSWLYRYDIQFAIWGIYYNRVYCHLSIYNLSASSKL